ncbi:MAG: FliA/WhiG family RNA polymerase sigma factor [Chitinivibrionia bacterium]|nr:FliA/WhiG family RNA polymerase sigma factor [Chitinivibrionia bacterium]
MSNIDTLWEEYRSSGSKVAKDKLLAEYAGLVKYIAERVGYTLPRSVDKQDLVSCGILGLIKAVETFDPNKEIKFETFASHKIRGAILDELRALDWVPRSVRQKTKFIQRAYSELEEKLGRSPYDDEVCAHLGLSSDEFEKMLSDSAPITVFSIDATFSKDSESREMSISETIEDTNTDNPLQILGYEEVKRVLKEAIMTLPEKEKLVIALYHFEELTLKEIGVVLGITESRVSQIHSKVMLKLRSRLQIKMKD